MAKESDLLERLIEAKESPIDIAKVATEWLKLVGGAKGLAERLENEYENAKVGSQTRARLLEMIIRLTERAFDNIHIADMSLVSDADLEKLAMKYLNGGKNGQERKSPVSHDPITDSRPF